MLESQGTWLRINSYSGLLMLWQDLTPGWKSTMATKYVFLNELGDLGS